MQLCGHSFAKTNENFLKIPHFIICLTMAIRSLQWFNCIKLLFDGEYKILILSLLAVSILVKLTFFKIALYKGDRTQCQHPRLVCFLCFLIVV